MPKRLKQKIKEEKKLLRAKTKEGWRLQKNKPLEVSLREHVGTILDNTALWDIAKFMSWVSMTILVKSVIDTTQELVDHLNTMQNKMPEAYQQFPALVKKWEWEKETTKPSLVSHIASFLGSINSFEWFISMVIAYLIIEHFGMVMQGVGNIFASVKSLVTGFIIGG